MVDVVSFYAVFFRLLVVLCCVRTSETIFGLATCLIVRSSSDRFRLELDLGFGVQSLAGLRQDCFWRACLGFGVGGFPLN